MRRLFVVLLVLGIALVSLDSHTPTSAVSGGTLFAGTDDEEFNSTPLPDRLAVMTTSGGAITGNVIKNGQVYLNGLAATGAGTTGTLFSGDALSNKHNVLDYNGNLVSSITGPLPANVPGEANEDLAFDGTNVWRAHWPGGPLFKYSPVTGSTVNSYAQSDVVGAEFVGCTLWITKWNGQQVGTFDPVTNTFTPKFTTAAKAGGLAYDAGNNIMWVGLQGGTVEAWNLTGIPTKIVGSDFQPFGPTGGDVVDGLAFVPTVPCEPVGGISELVVGDSSFSASPSDGSGSIPYATLAGGLAAAVALMAGGWYTRRRWLQ